MKGKKIAISLILVLFLATLVPSIVTAQDQVPNGPWVDEITFQQEPDESKAVDMLIKGDVHIHLIDIADPDLLPKIKASPELTYNIAYGLYYELSFNPSPFETGFNPFSNPKIREAMNYLIDRNYIVDEISKGLAVPKWVPTSNAFPDYGRLAPTIKLIEAKYAYNFDKAREIITAELEKMGAHYSAGRWYYNDEPITITLLIRNDDIQRKLIGDYVANQLEKLGFATERKYGSSPELAVIWAISEPPKGLWHIYTGGWISTAFDREAGDDFLFYYTNKSSMAILGYTLWKYYVTDNTFYEIADRLDRGDWSSWEERDALFRQALELCMKDSVRIWVINTAPPMAMRKEIQVATDLVAGFQNDIWARTIRFKDRVGGTIKASDRAILNDPWNPVGGTNYAYDLIIQSCTNDFDVLYNPYTGLPMPNNFESATMEIEEGSVTTWSSDWINVSFVPSIEVPTDAWYDWDVKNKKIITAPPGTYAKAKVTINYGDVIGKVKYHDGSVMSLADWFAFWPLPFERANPESSIYDESYVPAFESFRTNYQGQRLISTHPLVIEYYVNYSNPEAEFIATYAAEWPNMPWHAVAVGMKAEEEGTLAWTSSKSKANNVEWMNYIGGTSIPLLKNALATVKAEGYRPLLASEYATAEEAAERYNKLTDWVNAKGHFWVCNGPFYLELADFSAHTAVVKAFRDYRWKADRWAWLSSPPIPEGSVVLPEIVAGMPGNIVPGVSATFTLNLQIAGNPYPNNKIDFVKYLVLDSAGNVITSGNAVPGAEGEWAITLTQSVTAEMREGTYTLMTIALSKDVAMPGIINTPFTVTLGGVLSYFNTVLEQREAQLNAALSALQATQAEQTAQLQSAISSLQTTVYAAIAVAVISLLIAIYAVVTKKS